MKIEEFNPVDGTFFLISGDGFLAKAFTLPNARLIAAAPELLEALKRAESMLCKQEDALRALGADEPDAESAILTARAAIAKATGK